MGKNNMFGGKFLFWSISEYEEGFFAITLVTISETDLFKDYMDMDMRGL